MTIAREMKKELKHLFPETDNKELEKQYDKWSEKEKNLKYITLKILNCLKYGKKHLITGMKHILKINM